ncbi:hypothetical protein KY306_01640 [Candidatus Woesearchaeota archaeon]|nr:hypothetical protein [Candidatus Woesearchaeota archaeon]
MMYPIIKGDQILFSEDVSRGLRDLEVPATHEEFRWLAENYGRGIVYIPEKGLLGGSGFVAISSGDFICRNPLNTVTVHQYDNVVRQLGEVEKLLETHRKNGSEN